MKKEITIKEAEIWLEKLEHLESKAAKLLHIKNLLILNEKLKCNPPIKSNLHRVYKRLEVNPLKVGTDLETTPNESDLSVSTCDCDTPEIHTKPK